MKLHFFGAARNVTGSRTLLTAGDRRLLIDCGLYQEREFLARNWEPFPCPPADIAAVILTHAHLDHCGYLPRLVAHGFRGQIFCTGPTAEITSISLLDSGRIQEEDAAQKKRRHEREGRRGRHPEVPLYTAADAARVRPRLAEKEYEQPFEVVPGISASFHDAGHILGAAMVRVTVHNSRPAGTVVFSGDIGRWNKPVLRDPSLLPAAGAVVMETTYGNRSHGKPEKAGTELVRIIGETAARKGNVIIPTFAIERAQEILFHLAAAISDGRLPRLPVFVDSPMAISVTEVFRKYPAYLDRRTARLIEAGRSPFDFPQLQLTRDAAASRAIRNHDGPCVIMAGSGMCTGGRIKHHLAANIENPAATVLFVGYQARHTLGRQILGRPESVRILGRHYRVRARIEQADGFSAHADREELRRWLGGFEKMPGRVFLAHGEEEAAAHFRDRLAAEKTGAELIIPEYRREYDALA